MLRGTKYSVIALAFFISLNAASCTKKNQSSNEKKKINIYVDVKDKYSLDIVKFVVDKYKKEKSSTEINLINPLNSDKLEEDLAKGEGGDLILTSRNTMISLSKKGLLNDLANIYSKNKISDKYYNILSAYGRVGDKYYGVGVMPFSIEVFYNKANLKKIGLSEPTGIKDLVDIFKKVNETNMKVPVLLPEDMDIYNGLASIIFSNTSDLNKLEEKYDSGEQGYKELKEMQRLFNDVFYLAKTKSINQETFELANDIAVKRLVNGDTPILIGSSYLIKELKEDLKNTDIGIIEKYNISNVKENVPVIVNCVAIVPTGSKNEEDVNSFLEFLFSEKTQKQLAEEGFVTANKTANGEPEGVKKIVNSHLMSANENSIVYIYNLPKKFQAPLEAKLDKVLSGKYQNNEWEQIVKQVYGK
jgi:raffinose/stachyose/melibiose transport system substrate-binding protein